MKSPYIKPNSGGSKRAGNYARYIGTREGVVLTEDTLKHLPATQKQEGLIQQILKDFPDSTDLHEYTDYKQNPTRENASEFIGQALEAHSGELAQREKYVSYIAERPGVEKLGKHGLFTDAGIPVVLEQVSREMAECKSNIWTHIISLRREDAARLGYDSVEDWVNLLRSKRNVIAQQMRIKPENFRWYAAFHDAGHHPHVHLMAYSIDPKEAYLTEKGIEAIKGELAREIFRQDHISIYQKQTQYRDQLRQQGRESVAQIVEQINAGEYRNELIEDLLRVLSTRLAHTSGRKQYGYLKSDLKAIVDQIVMELAKDDRIQNLYDLWYEQREDVLRTYTDTFQERIPLEQNREFKSIRNAVIQEAMKITEQIQQTAREEPYQDVPEIGLAKGEEPEEGSIIDPEYWKNRVPPVNVIHAAFDEGQSPPTEERIDEKLLYRIAAMCISDDGSGVDYEQARRYFEAAAEQGNADALYGLGRLYLWKDYVGYDPVKAIEYLEQSAEKDHAFAKYQLGKLLCEGEVCEKNIARGLKLLEELAEKGVSIAGYLTGKVYLREKEWQDIKKAVLYFKKAAEDGNSYAEYQLGKIYYFGTGVRADAEKGLEYLKASADHGNAYAADLLRNIQYQQTRGVVKAANSLLAQLGRLFQEKEQKQEQSQRLRTDRKYRREIDEKKQALGIRD